MSGLYTEGLMKRYGSRTALSDVSIHLDKGEVVGLLGPNGAGKTTCFYAIAGFVRPDRCRVMLGDKDISHYPIHRRARHGLSYLPQESSIFTGLTAEENILAVLEIKGVAGKEKRLLTQKLLEDMGLEHLADVNALAFSVANAEKWKSPACWRGIRILFCWMNPLPLLSRFQWWIYKKPFADCAIKTSEFS